MSGDTTAAAGHAWIGCDISLDMLAIASGIPVDSTYSLKATLTAAQQPSDHSTPDQGPQPCQSQPASTSVKSRTGFNALNHKPFEHLLRASAAKGRGLVMLSDMAQGLPVRKHSMDGAISISAVQWLCHHPDAESALSRLFNDLYNCLKPSAKAVLQVYIAGSLSVHYQPCLVLFDNLMLFAD